MAASSSSQHLTAPDAKMFFVVKPITVIGVKANIFVDDIKVASLKPGESKSVAVHPGQHEIKVKSSMNPGKYVIQASVGKGETAYFMLSRNKSTVGYSFLGPIGNLAHAALSDKSSQFDIRQVTKQEALH